MWYTSSEWWLVIIAGLTGAAIAYQAWEMRRATDVMQEQLGDIKKQTDLLGEYVKATKDGVEATRKAAEAANDSARMQAQTVILQYRPKLIVRGAKASNFNVADLGEPARANVTFTVINTGGTQARITGGYIAMWSVEATKNPAPIEFQCGKDDPIGEFILQPGEEKVFERILGAGMTNDIQWANYHQALQTDPLRYIYLVGTLFYLDDLDIPRNTGIHRCYDPKTRTFLPEKSSDQEYAD